MRKILISIGTVLLLTTSSLSLAQPDKNKLDTHTNQANQQVMLYDQPDIKSKVLENLKPTSPLIPIIHQKGWLKVGDPNNGQVGWINIKQYHAAKDAFFQPNIQTMMVQVNQSGKGKPTITVIAYKNGTKLDDKDAQNLYEQIKGQQERHQRHMQGFTDNMNGLFRQDFREIKRFIDDSSFDFAPVDLQFSQPFADLPDFDTGRPQAQQSEKVSASVTEKKVAQKDNSTANNKASEEDKNKDNAKIAKDNTNDKNQSSATTAKEIKS